MLRVMREAKPAMVRVLADMASAAEGGADLVVHHANQPAHHIAEYLGVPAVPVGLQPVWVPTRGFPNPILPVRVPAALNSSLPNAGPEQTGQLLVRAVRNAGVRAVIAAGPTNVQLDHRCEDVLLIDQVPHDWIFPRVAAAVHAGGAGTTSEALRTNRPQVLCPSHVEQRFWAQRMHALDVACEPLPMHRLDANRLTDAILHAVTDQTLPRRAQQLAPHIRTENGLARAITLLEAQSAR